MKFSILPLVALAISQVAIATPAPNPVADDIGAPEPTVYTGPEPNVDARALEKRANSGTVKVDGLKYRKCPKTSCTAVGQYPKGTKISITCYTRTDTTVVEGDAGWGKLTNGYYVALAFGKYVSWTGSIPVCR